MRLADYRGRADRFPISTTQGKCKISNIKLFQFGKPKLRSFFEILLFLAMFVNFETVGGL